MKNGSSGQGKTYVILELLKTKFMFLENFVSIYFIIPPNSSHLESMRSTITSLKNIIDEDILVIYEGGDKSSHRFKSIRPIDQWL